GRPARRAAVLGPGARTKPGPSTPLPERTAPPPFRPRRHSAPPPHETCPPELEKRSGLRGSIAIRRADFSEGDGWRRQGRRLAGGGARGDGGRAAVPGDSGGRRLAGG